MTTLSWPPDLSRAITRSICSRSPPAFAAAFSLLRQPSRWHGPQSSKAVCSLFSTLWTTPTLAQAPTTRVEEIEQARREKMARLWPERESPLVARVNRLIERGLGTGIETGKGVNGPHFVLGGMRSGQGMTVGLGYRRADIWHERFDFRTTARMTPQLAYMFDAKLDFNSLRSTRWGRAWVFAACASRPLCASLTTKRSM